MGLAYTERVGTRKVATAITMMATDLMENPLANSLAVLLLPNSPLRGVTEARWGYKGFRVEATFYVDEVHRQR